MKLTKIMRFVSARVCRVWVALALLGLGMCPVALPITTALSSSNGSFFNAFTDPAITEILVTLENYQLSRDAWSAYSADNPYVLRRDLTVRSTLQPVGQLDFDFLDNKVLIASNVSLTFENVAMLNVKKLGGFGLDFFMGEDNSTIIMRNVIRVKLVCNPVDDALASARSYTTEFPSWPPNKVSVRNETCVTPPTPQKPCYRDSLQFDNFTFEVSTADPEAGYSGAYLLHMTNTTRVCEHYVTQECIQQSGLDTCTAQLVDQLLNRTETTRPLSGAAIAGVVVGGAVVLAFIALCVYYRKKFVRYLAPSDDKSSEGGGSRDGEPDTSTTTLLPSGTGEVVTTHKSSARETVRLGVLLGSGSFGRVYRGRWHGTDVAVKIIMCSISELPKVLKEAEVMMQLNHPNIVRAFQCSVFNPLHHQRALKGSKDARASARKSPGLHPLTSSTTTHPSGSTQQQTSSTASGARPAGATDSVVVNIMPEIVQRQQRQSAAAAASSSASGQSSTTSHIASSGGAGVRASGELGSGTAAASGSTSSSEAARRLFDKVLQPAQQHQQQQQQQYFLQGTAGPGPSTRSLSQEGYWRRVTTPTSSVALTAAGSSGRPSGAYPANLPQPGSSDRGSLGQHSAPLMFVPVAASRGPIQHGVVIPAPGSTGSPSLASVSPRPHSQEMMSYTAGSRGSSQMHSSGPSALGEGRDGTAWSSMLLGPRVPSSGRRSGTTSSSSHEHSTTGTGELQQVASPVSEIQPAWGGLERRKQANGSGSDQHISEEKSGQLALGEAEQADDSSSEGRKPDVQVWLVLELCNGGTLKDAVSMGKLKVSNRLEVAKLLSRLMDAANGMAYLHSRGILHGDLKAGNVLLFNSIHGAYGQISKISDFGLAATLMDGATHRSTASMGTITHMAPEVLRSGHMSAAADVYSFGIMMWEVYTNNTAHAGLHYGAVVERVVVRGERPPVPGDMPIEYAMLMKSCWDADATKRPTFTQVLQCLELLLDNLTSDSENRISEGSEGQSSSVHDDVASDQVAARAEGQLPNLSPSQKLLQQAAAVKQAASEAAAAVAKEPGLSGSCTSASLSGPPTVSERPSLAQPSSTETTTPALGVAPAAGTDNSYSGAVQELGSSGGQQMSLQCLQDLQRWQSQQQESLRQGIKQRGLATPGSPATGSSSRAAGSSGAGGSGLGGSTVGSSSAGTWTPGQLPNTPTPVFTAVTRPLVRPSTVAEQPPSAAKKHGDVEGSPFIQDL